MITGHGGDIHEAARQAGCSPADIMDMSSNVNPLGPVPGLVAHLCARLEKAAGVPDLDRRLVEHLTALLQEQT